MRLLSRLEYEQSFGARWVTYFVRIPLRIEQHTLLKADAITAQTGIC